MLLLDPLVHGWYDLVGKGGRRGWMEGGEEGKEGGGSRGGEGERERKNG